MEGPAEIGGEDWMTGDAEVDEKSRETEEASRTWREAEAVVTLRIDSDEKYRWEFAPSQEQK